MIIEKGCLSIRHKTNVDGAHYNCLDSLMSTKNIGFFFSKNLKFPIIIIKYQLYLFFWIHL